MSIVFFDLDGTLVDEDGNIPPSAALAIRRLREKLEANPASPVHIMTKWGVGYYFTGEEQPTA